MEPSFYWLKQVQPEDQNQVGDRAWQLAQLQHQGYGVSPGFVVSAAVFQYLGSAVRSSLLEWVDTPTIDTLLSHPKQLQTIAQRGQQVLWEMPLPTDLQHQLQAALAALRDASPRDPLWLRISFGSALSGAAHDLLAEQWVPTRDWESFIRALRTLWADLLSARNLIYWETQGLEFDRLPAAVLVQAIAPPIVHGLLQMQTDPWSLKLLSKPIYQSVLTIAEQYWLADSYALQDGLALPTNLPPILPAPILETLLHLGQQLHGSSGSPQTIHWMLQGSTEQALSLLILDVWDDHTLLAPPGSSLDPGLSAPAPRRLSSYPPDASRILLQGMAIGDQRCRGQAVVWDSPEVWEQDFPAGAIAVLKTLHPSWIGQLRHAIALIIEEGGLTSHGAIIARELGLPAIVGAATATTQIQTGDWLRIENGNIYRIAPRSPAPDSPVQAVASESSSLIVPMTMESPNPLPNLLLHGTDRSLWPITATQLFVTLSQPESLPAVTPLPIAGLGLLRSEQLLARCFKGRSPEGWLQQVGSEQVQQQIAAQLGQFVAGFAPRPVFYRTLDWYADDPAGVLGVHGTLSYALASEWFAVELSAIAQVQQHYPDAHLKLVLPFVRSLEEFQHSRRSITAAGLWDSPQFELWMMAEVPAVIFSLESFIAAGVQGIVIGTGDLSQLLFGLDRERSGLLDRLPAHHPALLSAITQLLTIARKHHLPSILCSHFSTPDPDLLDAVISQGVTGVSVNPDAIETSWRAIAEAEQRCLLNRLRHCCDTTDAD